MRMRRRPIGGDEGYRGVDVLGFFGWGLGEFASVYIFV